VGLGGRHRDPERGRRLGEGSPCKQAVDEARLGGREGEGRGHGLRSLLFVNRRPDEHGCDRLGLEPRTQFAAGQRQNMREAWGLIVVAQTDGEAGLAERSLVLGRKGDGAMELPAAAGALACKTPRTLWMGPPWRIIRSAARLA
jgi:hypothetical protein